MLFLKSVVNKSFQYCTIFAWNDIILCRVIKTIMYIRQTKNQKGQSYYHLVESYRANGKVKQRTLMSLGKVEDNRIGEVSQAIAKFTEQVSAIDIAKSIDVEHAYILGPSLILEH